METNPSLSKRNAREKWKNFKHKELILVFLLLIVVALFWFAIRSPSSASVDVSSLSQREQLTYQLRDAVNSLSGDDDCKVVISWSQEENTQETTSIFGNSTQNESTMIDGIAVICKNGRQASVKVNITTMLSTLFGISPQRIAVYEKI